MTSSNHVPHHLYYETSFDPLLHYLCKLSTTKSRQSRFLIESGRSRSRWRLIRSSFLDIAQTVRTHLDPVLGEDLCSFPRLASDAGTSSRAIRLVIMDIFFRPWKWFGRRPPGPGRNAGTSPSRCVLHVCLPRCLFPLLCYK